MADPTGQAEPSAPATMQDRPEGLPGIGRDGDLVRGLTQSVLERKNPSSFSNDPVEPEFLDSILKLATQAPSSYNLQPWRFIVVRDGERRARLREASRAPEAVFDAPVIVIALGMKEEYEAHAEAIVFEAARRGAMNMSDVSEVTQAALDFVATVPPDVWVTRQTTAAVTILALAAEAYGFDTTLIEEVDPKEIRRDFAIPDDAEIVALVAIGRSADGEQPYPGRLPLSRTVFFERFGSSGAANADTEAQ
jgi:nitroreductase